MKTAAPPRPLAFSLLTFASGAASLACQLIWTRQFAACLGHELPATFAVIFAFLAGLALGAWALEHRVAVTPNPAGLYARLELIVGLWGLVLSVVIPRVGAAAAIWTGIDPSPVRQWTISLAVPLFVLLPSTAALGATLPALERCLSASFPNRPWVAAAYGLNTFGAMVGTLAGPFLLLPGFGFQHSLQLVATLNLVCAAVAWKLSRHPAKQEPPAGPVTELAPEISRGRLLASVVGLGFIGLALETVALRVLNQTLENTIYTFAAILSIYLLGTALGAALIHRRMTASDILARLPHLFLSLAVALPLSALVLAMAPILYQSVRSAFGDSLGGVLLAEMVVAALGLTLPTMLLGAAFTLLVQLHRQRTGRIGTIVALNTAAAAIAVPVVGLFLQPVLGPKPVIILLALGSLALVPQPGRFLPPIVFGAMAALMLLVPSIRLQPGVTDGRIIEFREGTLATVAVVESGDGSRVLRVNHRLQMGGTAAAAAQQRGAHLPLLLHPNPRRALFLGLGTGITLGAAGLHPNLSADGVELVPEILEVLPRFGPENRSPASNPNLQLHTADARRFVRATTNRYDVIVADLFHPALDGAGSLYTREHFTAIRDRLAPGGLFCQWLPLHQLDEPTLRLITRTFLEAFPQAQACLLHLNVDAPVLGLIATTGQPPQADGWIESRLSGPLESALKQLALADSVRFFGLILADSRALRSWAGPGPINTDDTPLVMLRAPLFSFQQHTRSYGRLQGLLQLPPPDYSAILYQPAPSTIERLSAYTHARNIYLAGLIDDAEDRSDAAIDRYIESAGLSADFTPGYAQCLSHASLLATSKPDAARRILERLIAARPERPVAADLLRRLPAP